jgi:protocatechuate 3,4-dioxygenase beta subunit
VRAFSVALLIAGAVAAQQVEAPKTARVTGRVVSESGEPVRRAAVKLLGRINPTQSTDGEGAFVFENVPAGAYVLIALRRGYSVQKYGATTPLVRDCYGQNLGAIEEQNPNPIGISIARRCIERAPGTTLSLAAGREITGLVIQLTRQGVVSGRVLDRDGEAVPRWRVQAMKVVYDRGVRRLEDRTGAGTDTDGNYSIDYLPPGRYYLRAVNMIAHNFAGLSQDRTGKAPLEADIATYFPSELDASRAVPVDVTPGADLRGLDIVVHREQVHSIRGAVVVPVNGGQPGNRIVTLTQKGGVNTTADRRDAMVQADGSFEFRSVEPGGYFINAGLVGYNGAAPDLFAKQEVTVSVSDVDSVRLALTPGFAITGTVKVEDETSGTWPSISLREVEGSRTTGLVNIDSKGAFTFTGKAAPSRYLVNLRALPPGTYVKSIRYGNQDALHSPLDLTGGATGRLAIVLSSKVGSIVGTVKNAKDEAVPGVVVSVWPRTPEVAGGVKSGSIDQNGNFEIPDLGAGDFFVAAWEDIDPGLVEYPEFLARFQNEAAAVTLEEGARANADLKLISRERIASEVAKLP